jgi:serine/threonine protein kinase
VPRISACSIFAVVCIVARRKREVREWAIDYSELEILNEVGHGAFGSVHRANWKGTCEVAVKTINAERITRDVERDFKEVRIMTALRHPNVVMFMAACIKPPKLAIVMECMRLGLLFDLLHNELISEIPFDLNVKVAYQAAKGMHFLHSSGIVHRDLKPLNLLLDAKWDVKISDFGLTKFKEDIGRGNNNNGRVVGSLLWTAPEILSETPNADYMLADVYSFGVIMWEILMREQPYAGLSPAAVAVAVIRDRMRPPLPVIDATSSIGLAAYVGLISECWHHDPTMRPAFLDIMSRMAIEPQIRRSLLDHDRLVVGRWRAPAARAEQGRLVDAAIGVSVVASSSALSSTKGKTKPDLHPDGVETIVFTDITRVLWEFDPQAMRDATVLHNMLEALEGREG